MILCRLTVLKKKFVYFCVSQGQGFSSDGALSKTFFRSKAKTALCAQNGILCAQNGILCAQNGIFLDVDFINNFDID